MMERRRIRSSKSEEGIALLISIFVLLLISVVAISLIVSSGTESALAGNYRSSTSVYYAAVAGLEEVRARLRPQSPISFKNTDAAFLPAAGAPLAVCSPIYVINPVGGENVTPWDAANPYYDGQFSQEFGGVCPAPLPPNPSTSTPSIWNRNPLNGLPFPGPLYKWVRINGVSELSLNLDTFPYDTTTDATLVYYDGTRLNDQNTGNQVLEVTALAVLPNGSQKLVQYLAAPTPLNLNFNAALTLDGQNMQPNVQFTVPNSSNFSVRGNDQYSAGSCNPGPGAVDAVGYTDPSDSNITSAIHAGPPASQDRRANYTGVVPTLDVVPVTVSGNLQTVAGLNALVQTITQNADVVVNGDATQSSMPAAMSASNPMTIVINGDLTFNGWHNTGYGLLLVTGTFTFDPDATWNGIVLVIGKGKLYSHQGGNGQFNGAVFLASTVDSSGNPLPPSSPPGTPNFDFTSSSGSNGIYYSSCWIQAAMPTAGYRILSFHEIAQ
jgi:Tfp pilus assembly protein PilX